MAMREKYTTPGTSIYYYLLEWDPAKLSWEDFRGSVLGPTNPKDAPPGALRGEPRRGRPTVRRLRGSARWQAAEQTRDCPLAPPCASPDFTPGS